jgi:glycosyltransferase involved in cell wall biosynthesis
MRIALVASSFLPSHGRLERHVDELARGLAERGAQVEVLTQGLVRGTQRVELCDNVTVRSFPGLVGPLRFAVAPKSWERLHLAANAFDLVDVHTRQAPLALAVGRAGFRRLVFTPHAPIQRFLQWPYERAIRGLVDASAQIVLSSEAERDLLCRTLPLAARRARAIPAGVDAPAIHSASPFASSGTVVLSVGRLEPTKCVDRAIAAMASAERDFRLVIVGDGPARYRLRAHADDLRITSRVQFVGPVPDRVLYRWLRTARIVVTLAREHSSGSQVIEALAAGASVVASDIPVHRLAAAQFANARAIFVPPEGSPLEVADAIAEAARIGVPSDTGLAGLPVPSWDSVVDETWRLYEQLISGAGALTDERIGAPAAGLTTRFNARADARRAHTVPE